MRAELYLDPLIVAVHRAQTGQVAEMTGSSRAGRLLRRSYMLWKNRSELVSVAQRSLVC